MSGEIQRLEKMTVKEVMKMYDSLKSPIPIVGTGKNGRITKKDILQAIYETATKNMAKPKPKSFFERERLEEIGINFSHCYEQVIEGFTSVIRMNWSDSQAQMYIDAYREKKLIAAWDNDLSGNGGLIGWLELVCEPYQELLTEMPYSDIANEGLSELSVKDYIKKYWGTHYKKRPVWVVRYKFYPLFVFDKNFNGDELPIWEKYGFYQRGKASQSGFEVPNSILFNGWSMIIGIREDMLFGSCEVRSVSLLNWERDQWWIKKVEFELTDDEEINKQLITQYCSNDCQRLVCELMLLSS